jgi:EmrB/QacA subfamily drug resistance transporter
MSKAPAGRTTQPGLSATLVVSLAQFLVVADTTIVSVAMPTIRSGLGMSAADQEWVIGAYLVVFGGLLVLGGRCGDVFGRTRVFLIGMGVLAVASLLGGLATDAGMLIIARALQGVAAALIAPAPLALIASIYTEPAARVRAIAIWNAVAASGLAAGIVFGGLLAGTVGWRWTLLINVPAAAIITVAARAVLPRAREHGSWRKIDLPGGILGTVGIGALVYALSAAQERPWLSVPVAGALALAVVTLIGFGIVESRASHPLIRMGLFRLRGVVAGNLGMLLSGAIVTTTIFFLSLLLQEVRGYTALSAALAMLPLTITIPVASTQAVRVLRAIGPRAHLAVFAMITALGLAWQSASTSNGSYVTGVLLPGLVVGVGLGGIGLAITSAAMAVPESDSGIASALVSASRQIGGSLGIALLSNELLRDPTTALGVSETAHAYSTALLFGSGFGLALALVSLLIPRVSRDQGVRTVGGID